MRTKDMTGIVTANSWPRVPVTYLYYTIQQPEGIAAWLRMGRLVHSREQVSNEHHLQNETHRDSFALTKEPI